MEVYTNMKHVGMVAMVLAVCVLVVCQTVALAQNLGAAPQVNVAVQGQTGAQPEGAFLNFVNWVGNVIGRRRRGGGRRNHLVCEWTRLHPLDRHCAGIAGGVGSNPVAGVLDRATATA